MHEMYGVSLQEVALALGISLAETERLLKNARGRVRAADKAPH
jgi:DNA-directed RNA polymerase specialized sigma24 family protein